MSTKQTPNEVEEVKDLEQVEKVQDLTEIEDLTKTLEEIKEIKEPVEEVKAPVLRGGGLRGAADPNMIQKHIDNFLAMLCGETPVDSNVRTSAEYWLKRLASGEGSGSTKKIYWHTVRYSRTTTSRYRSGYFIILNNSETPIVSTDIVSIMKTPGFVLKVYDGHSWAVSEGVYTMDRDEEYFAYNSATDLVAYYRTPGDAVLRSGTVSFTQTPFDVVDLGANPIN